MEKHIYRGYDIEQFEDGFWVCLHGEKIIGPAIDLASAEDLVGIRRKARASRGLDPVGARD